MSIRPLYTLSGKAFTTKAYPPTAAAIVKGAVVELSDGDISVPSGANAKVFGIALGTASAAGVVSGVDAVNMLVAIFDLDTVYAVTNTDDPTVTTPLAAHVGDGVDLHRASASSWGIDVGTAATASTPQFRIVDIDTVRGEWHVVVDPITVASRFQWITA